MPVPRLLTVEEVVDLLGLHPDTVRRYIREGQLRAVKLGRVWRVDEEDLGAFVEAHKTPIPEGGRDG